MENPFEYREYESPVEEATGLPTYRNPAPVLQDLLSLAMFVAGLWCGFCCIGPTFAGINRLEWLFLAIVTITLGYGLHRDSPMALAGTLLLFIYLLVMPLIPYLRWRLPEPWFYYALPLIGVVATGWLIMNYRRRHGHKSGSMG
ncbi:MAG: hypothetical protein AB8G99_01210 [Planctomycetaceae bacterium]